MARPREGFAMPLRDHFRPPLINISRWQALHAVWPSTILFRLNSVLPEGYRAEPRVQLGTEYEIDIGTIDARPAGANGHPHAGGGGTAVLTAHEPTVDETTELEEPDEAGVNVYGGDGELVAAVELVSRRNKDRPDSRRDFAEKVATLVRRGVCVSVVDVVSDRRFNLYADALDLLGHADPTVGDNPPTLYAATCRAVGRRPGRRFQAWSHPLRIGQPLPTLPLWLTEDLSLDLNLELSYEDAYQALRLPATPTSPPPSA